MWRLFQKGLKCGKSVKATCIVACPEDAHPFHSTKKTPNGWVIQCSHFHGNYESCGNRGPGIQCSEFHGSYEDSGGGGPEHPGGAGGSGPDREWKWRMNAFRHDMWSRHGYCHLLEAVGWGSAVITGFQVTDLCHRNRHLTEEKKCWFQNLMSNVPRIDWSQISHLLTTCSSYTVSLLSQTLMTSTMHILPVIQSQLSGSTSLSASIQSVNVVEGNDITTQSKSDEVPVDQAEDFNARLHFSTVSNNVKSNDTSSPSAVITDSVWLELLKQHVAAVRQNASAIKSANNGDLSTAVQIWSHACSSPVPSPLSLFNLAVCYEQGLGIEQNPVKAAELYQKASDLGHAKSAYNLAMMIVRESDSSESIKRGKDLLEKAAELGLKEAQRELGVLYTEEPQRDMERAAQPFEKASAQQDARATYFLGICYERGLGVMQNEAKAASLYKLSGEQGCGDAMYNLAVFFEHGMGGLPLDMYEAVRYYQAASNAGVSQAAEKLNIVKMEHPLLTAIVSDSQESKSLDRRSWVPFNQLFSFSLSSDSESNERSGVSSPLGSDNCSSDDSTGCSGRPLWQLRTKKKTEDVFYLHNASSGNSTSGEGLSHRDSINRLIDKHRFTDLHPDATDPTASGRSLDSTNLLHLGAFGKVSMPRVSSKT